MSWFLFVLRIVVGYLNEVGSYRGPSNCPLVVTADLSSIFVQLSMWETRTCPVSVSLVSLCWGVVTGELSGSASPVLSIENKETELDYILQGTRDKTQKPRVLDKLATNMEQGVRAR